MDTPSHEPVFGDCYQLIWRNRIPGAIALVRNFTLDRQVCRGINIFLNPDFEAKNSMRFICSIYDKNGVSIEVSPEFMTLPPDMRLAGIWHEVGHAHHEHYFRRTGSSPDVSYRIARKQAMNNGQVHPFELEADAFAVRQIGRCAVAKSLEFLLKTRPRGEKGSNNEVGHQELYLRMQSLSNLHGEESRPCQQSNPETPYVWYFAYGSNMSKEQMQERTGPIIEAWPAALDAHELAFNKAMQDGTGAANIVRKRGSQVLGVAYRCHKTALEKLDHFEGVARQHYKRRFVNIVFSTGEERRAITYIACPGRVQEGLKPSEAYLEKIVKGASSHGLPAAYIADIVFLSKLTQ